MLVFSERLTGARILFKVVTVNYRMTLGKLFHSSCLLYNYHHMDTAVSPWSILRPFLVVNSLSRLATYVVRYTAVPLLPNNSGKCNICAELINKSV